MRFLLDEMYGERVVELLAQRGHEALHVRSVGLAGAPDAEVLARAADTGRTLVTENARDFFPLLDERQSAGLSMTPVLVAVKASRGVGLADGIDRWASSTPEPYAHVHWLP